MKYKMALCIWEDISEQREGWVDIKDAMDWAARQDNDLVYQIGFVVEKTDYHVMMVNSYFSGCNLVGIMTKIPIGAVKEFKYL